MYHCHYNYIKTKYDESTAGGKFIETNIVSVMTEKKNRGQEPGNLNNDRNKFSS